MIAAVDPIPRMDIWSEVVIAHSYFTLPSLDAGQSTLELIRFVSAQHIKGLQEKLNAFCKKVIANPTVHNVDGVFSDRKWKTKKTSSAYAY